MTWQYVLALFGQGLGILLFCIAQLVALVMIPLGLPGLWFQVLAAAVLTVSTDRMGWWWTIAIAVIAALGEALDFLIGDLGLASVGASSYAAWGALVCGFVFAFFGFLIPIPIVGSVVMSFFGTFVGAILGEMAHEKKLHPKLHIALGAVVGRACGVAAKLSLTFVAAGIAVLALMSELVAVFVK